MTFQRFPAWPAICGGAAEDPHKAFGKAVLIQITQLLGDLAAFAALAKLARRPLHLHALHIVRESFAGLLVELAAEIGIVQVHLGAQLPQMDGTARVGLNVADRPEHRVVLLEHLIVGHGLGIERGAALTVQPGDLQGASGLTEPFRRERPGQAGADPDVLPGAPLLKDRVLVGKKHQLAAEGQIRPAEGQHRTPWQWGRETA